MSSPEDRETALEPGADATAATATAEATEAPAPAPEPWTPERVSEWNRYYDLYVAAAALLLVFLGATHKIYSSSLWTHLSAGQVAVKQMWPVVRDPFTFTVKGQPWVDIPWSFGVINALIHDLASGFTTDADRGEQIAAGTLILINATIRALTALILFRIRRPGPGLWWAAICAALALGGMVVPAPTGRGLPFSATLGGIAGVAEVDPEVWGLLLLALEIAALHSAFDLGRRRALYALPVLFLVWANVHDSFFLGLIILAATVVGAVISHRRARPSTKVAPSKAPTSKKLPSDSPTPHPVDADAPAPIPAGAALATLAACAAVALVNPSFHRIYLAVIGTFLDLLPGRTAEMTLDQISFFGTRSREVLDRGGTNASRLYIAYYLLTVGTVLASFVVNRRRFRLGRFLGVVAAALLWAILAHLSGLFAVVGAAALALNGQEWYQDRYGVEGRLGRGWATWSIGGRLVTLGAIFALVVLKGLMGYGTVGADIPVGLGVNPDEFAFEAADYLHRDAKIQGNILNLTLSHGDAINWRTWPRSGRGPFIDSRKHLFPRELRQELREFRRAFRPDDKGNLDPAKQAAAYQALDRRQITAVMISIRDDRAVYDTLARDPDWIEFYDDGKVVMFGRADKPTADLAYFKDHRLDADELAFQRPKPIPSVPSPPTPVSWIDNFFRSRAHAAAQPHSFAADRWISLRWGEQNTVPDPAHCLMAIREARTALSKNPDDTAAFRILNRAYYFLGLRERDILSRSPTAVPNDYLMLRYQQRATALKYAIDTTAPPATDEEKEELANLNLELADLFRGVNYLDLERDRLEEARKLTPADEFARERLERLNQLDEFLADSTQKLDEFALDQQAGPLQMADMALSRGMPKYAIGKLELADEQGVNLNTVKWRLFDLYGQTAQPERAIELVANIDDPTLNTGPGTPSHRQGLASLLIGNYDNAASLWRSRALPQLRGALAAQALAAGRYLVDGEVKGASVSFRELPGEIGDEASWEMMLGLALLESGPISLNAGTSLLGGAPAEDSSQPSLVDTAAEHLTKALTLRPNLPARALVAYYLEKLGKPVPPPPTEPSPALSPSPTPAPKGDDMPKDPFPKPDAGKEGSEAPKS
jgi:hypothetical protein